MASTAKQPRALALIAEEHQAILGLFEQLGRGQGDREELIDEALARIDIHQQLKREILYPALAEKNPDAAEALTDSHEQLEEMLDELDDIDLDEEEDEEDDEDEDDADEDADEAEKASAGTGTQMFADLTEQLRSHFEDEEETLQDLTEESGLDLDALGQQMEARREELRQELGQSGVIAG